jgi:hypothetical protein
MKKYYEHRFNNIGFLEIDLSEDDLIPIKKEVYEIKNNNFETALSHNKNLAGNIEKEFLLKKSVVSYLEQLIKPFCLEFDKIFQYTKNLNLLTDNKPLILDEAWVNFQKKYEFNPLHNHSGVFSFVIWIDIPYAIEDERNNVHSKDSNNNVAGCFSFFYIDSLGSILSYSIPADNTCNNKLILFPSKMSHCVYPFYTSEDYRISCSGNFRWKV